MKEEFSEVVQQKNFRSEQAKAALNIIFTANQLEEISRNLLKPYDISSEQYNVLRILRGRHPETYALQEVRYRMLNRWSNVSRLVEKLRQKGYVERQPMEGNRRKVEILITKKGLDFLDELEELPISRNIYDKALTRDQAEQLSSLLDTFRSNLEAIMDDQ
ncbi:MAG: MarR family transcriptional regulator [Balneolaceae bacterium]